MMQDWADRLDQWDSQGKPEAATMSAPESVQIVGPQPSPKGSDGPIHGEGANIDTGTHEAANGSNVIPMRPAVMMIVSCTGQRALNPH
jgi:hypothetical protein